MLPRSLIFLNTGHQVKKGRCLTEKEYVCQQGQRRWASETFIWFCLDVPFLLSIVVQTHACENKAKNTTWMGEYHIISSCPWCLMFLGPWAPSGSWEIMSDHANVWPWSFLMLLEQVGVRLKMPGLVVSRRQMLPESAQSCTDAWKCKEPRNMSEFWVISAASVNLQLFRDAMLGQDHLHAESKLSDLNPPSALGQELFLRRVVCKRWVRYGLTSLEKVHGSEPTSDSSLCVHVTRHIGQISPQFHADFDSLGMCVHHRNRFALILKETWIPRTATIWCYLCLLLRATLSKFFEELSLYKWKPATLGPAKGVHKFLESQAAKNCWNGPASAGYLLPKQNQTSWWLQYFQNMALKQRAPNTTLM